MDKIVKLSVAKMHASNALGALGTVSKWGRSSLPLFVATFLLDNHATIYWSLKTQYRVAVYVTAGIAQYVGMSGCVSFFFFCDGLFRSGLASSHGVPWMDQSGVKWFS